MNKIEKQSSRTNYLLGINENGENVYLAKESWDCGWYWGFGYIKTRSSHAHYKGEILGSTNSKGEYVYHINMMDWQATTLTDKEAWELSELMRRFYVLKEAAELFYRGGCNVSGSSDMKDLALAEKINKELLPLVFKKVEKLLEEKL